MALAPCLDISSPLIMRGGGRKPLLSPQGQTFEGWELQKDPPVPDPWPCWEERELHEQLPLAHPAGSLLHRVTTTQNLLSSRSVNWSHQCPTDAALWTWSCCHGDERSQRLQGCVINTSSGPQKAQLWGSMA